MGTTDSCKRRAPCLVAHETFVFSLAQATPTAGDGGGSMGFALGVVFDAIVALCAFGALALGLWQEYARRQATKHQVRVTMYTGIIGLLSGPSNGEITVEAANTGEKPMTLAAQAMVKLPHGRRLLLPSLNSAVRFLYQRDPGRNCITWIALDQLADSLWNAGFPKDCDLIGIYRDQIDKKHESKPFQFDPSG